MNKLEPILPQHIDSTMISCFRSCRRKFFNEFILGLRPSEVSIDLHAGGAFSHALEHFYREYFVGPKAGDQDHARLVSFNQFNQYWGDLDAPSNSPKSKDNMWLALETYFREFPPATDHVQPYFVQDRPTFEFSFAIPLDGPDWPRHPVSGDPFLYSGRYDMLGTYHGAPCFRDEKTTKQAGPTWADQWDLRSQFIGYKWASMVSGIPIKWAVIRGIVIQKTSIRILEAIKDYPDALVERWREQLRHDLWQLVECWNTNYWDYNLADACTAYGGCMFKTSCLSANPEPWLETFIVRRWNPLAKDPVESTKGDEVSMGELTHA
jgi:hypothetical protein